MSRAASTSGSSVATRLAAFVLERHPFALASVLTALDSAGQAIGDSESSIDAVRRKFAHDLEARLRTNGTAAGIANTTPGSSAPRRFDAAVEEVVRACDGFLRRAAIRASLSPDERREILRGMLLTRAVDNRLKTFFTSGEVRFGDAPFQGKGFRSLGQEAIYAAAIRLRRGETFRDEDEGEWRGDIVAPLIRDLGVALAMKPDGETVRLVLSAQMGKAGPPMNGKDLHIGDLSNGILPAAAPLAVSTLNAAGMAMAFAREGSGRVALSFIGEGGSSLGEWHEAINLCAARRLTA
ncbi:MAG: hypothetical protein H0W53_18195, partial [Acidobacteria bacterium]|nr:hypothetical protein [Acidobacteriota bacterium]